MLPYIALGVAALLAWRSQSQNAHPAIPVMTDAQRLIFQNAVSDNGTVLSADQLTKLAQVFDGEGHSAEAEILYKRARVMSLSKQDQAVLAAAFKKGLSSKDPVAVRALANSFEAEGFFGNAAKLRDYANSLDVGNVIMQTAAVTPAPAPAPAPTPATATAPAPAPAASEPMPEAPSPVPASPHQGAVDTLGSAIGDAINSTVEGAASATLPSE